MAVTCLLVVPTLVFLTLGPALGLPADGGVGTGVAHGGTEASVEVGSEDLAVVLGLDDPLHDLTEFATNYAFQYDRTLRALSEATKNPDWNAEHLGEVKRLAQELKESWRSLRALSDRWSDDGAARRLRRLQDQSGAASEDVQEEALTTLPVTKHTSDAMLIVMVVMPFLFIIIAFVCLCFGRSYDIFSPLAHSRGLITVAFTITTLNSLLEMQSGINGITRNPLLLYAVQLMVCFVGVFGTLPTVVGTYQGAPKWMAVMSCILSQWYLISYLMSPDFIESIFIWDAETQVTSISSHMIIFLLSIIFSLLSIRHLCLLLLPVPRRFKFFTERFAEDCQAYAASFLKRGEETKTLPIHVPAMLVICFLGVLAFMGPTLFVLTRTAIQSRETVQALAVVAWELVKPLLRLGGIKLALTPDEAEALVDKALASFVVAEVAIGLSVFWIVWNVYRGYVRVFTALARGKPYKGHEAAIKSRSSFHPMYGSSFAGSLIGNVLVASVVAGVVTFCVTFALLQAQTWKLIWAQRNWLLFYVLLFVTKYLLFRFLVPRFVVSDRGLVYRNRIWSVLFPTMLLLNLILGALNGILRYVFTFPYFFLNAFRLDVTALPSGYESWDGSFQSFLALVLYSHSLMNPLVWVAVKQFVKFTGPGSPSESRKKVLGAPTAEELDDADADGEIKKLPTDRLMGTEEGRINLEDDTSAPRRARIRWHLAVTLARNPSVQEYRAHCLKIPSEKSGIVQKIKSKIFGHSDSGSENEKKAMDQAEVPGEGGDVSKLPAEESAAHPSIAM